MEPSEQHEIIHGGINAALDAAMSASQDLAEALNGEDDIGRRCVDQLSASWALRDLEASAATLEDLCRVMRRLTRTEAVA